jgi:Tol biopolymer transport system component
VNIALVALAAAALAAPPSIERSAKADETVHAQVESTPILFQTERNGSFDIYATDSGGRQLRPVLAGPANDQDPAWAPDGSAFAFSSDRTGTWQIFVTELRGTPRQITSGKASNVDPQWSPDGRSIAFETNRNGDWDIYTMQLDGTSQRNVSKRSADDFDPRWAPGGASLVFAGLTANGSDIHRAVLATGKIERVTTTAAAEFEPALSPAGDRIAFSRLVGRNYDIFVLNLRDRTEARLTKSRGVDEDPSWAPTGDRVAYTAEPSSPQTGRRAGTSISVIPAGGGVAVSLTGDRSGSDSEADWRPAAPGVARSAPVASAADHGPSGFGCGEPEGTGTAGSFDLVLGGVGANHLCGNADRDWVRGKGGRDHIAGGADRDRLEGGTSGDWIWSKDGEKDVLYGGTYSSGVHTDASSKDWAHSDKKKDSRHGINKLEP